MTNVTLVRGIAKQVTAKERLSMAGLYTVSMPFDMCGTGGGENQLPMKLAFGACAAASSNVVLNAQAAAPMKNLDAFALRAPWNSTEC